MTRRFAELALVLENQERTRTHAASGASGGGIELEGVLQGCEEQFEVFVGKACLVSKEGIDEAVGAVEGIGNGEFAPHRPIVSRFAVQTLSRWRLPSG